MVSGWVDAPGRRWFDPGGAHEEEKMAASRVLFKLDPNVVVAERTEIGNTVGWRLSPEGCAAVRAQLEAGPHLAAFDAGMDLVRDLAGARDFARLVLVRDRELLDAIDRDRALRAAAECETMVVDDPDAA